MYETIVKLNYAIFGLFFLLSMILSLKYPHFRLIEIQNNKKLEVKYNIIALLISSMVSFYLIYNRPSLYGRETEFIIIVWLLIILTFYRHLNKIKKGDKDD